MLLLQGWWPRNAQTCWKVSSVVLMPSWSWVLAPMGRPLALKVSSMPCRFGKLSSFHVNDPQGPNWCQFMSKIHASSGKLRASKSSTRARAESLSKSNHRVKIVPKAYLGGTAGGPAACTKSFSAPAKSKPCRKTNTSTEFLEGAYHPSRHTGAPVWFTTAEPAVETSPQAQCIWELAIVGDTFSLQLRLRVSASLSRVRAVPPRLPSAGSSPQLQAAFC
mmetsp:Transcript_58319/g.151542  ORF Transcript_58319/g.151542 Transcript_58319/m.151542 type:complete len:220 (-) Transcript_58319:7-666(-)